MGTLTTIIVGTAIVGLLSCTNQECDAKRKLLFQQPTPVMATPYPPWYKNGRHEVLFTMQTGQTLPICDFTPGKEFAIYKVQLPDGGVGYVEYDSRSTKEVAIAPARPATR